MIVSNKKGINPNDELADLFPVMAGMTAGVWNRRLHTLLDKYRFFLSTQPNASDSDDEDSGHLLMDTIR
jgi:hypothetical protein